MSKNIKDEIVHQDKNMIIFSKGDLYVEHNNHDNSCYLYLAGKKIHGFSGCLDLHPHIIDWVNNHRDFFFGDDLSEYLE